MSTVAIEGHETHAAHDHAGHDHHHQSFITKYIFSTDHKRISKQFMFSAMLFLFVGGALALGIRWSIAYPDQPIPILGKMLPSMWVNEAGILQPDFYTQMVTMHASIMIFLVIIPIATGVFGNLCIPLMIGTDDMALPRVNMVSFWLVPAAGISAVSSFYVEGGAGTAGWTSYPPLSVSSGMGQTLWLIAVFLVGFSSILGGVNYLTTILNKRAKGMGFFDMPMTIWALAVTAMLQTLGTPVLAAAVSMQFFDQFLFTSFFMPSGLALANGKVFSGGGMPILFQHLFWFYSHPAVYIMILPPMGVVSDVLATFARKPVYGYRAMVFALCAIAFLGFIVWGHHMFQSGMSPLLGTTFVLSTIVIAVPSAIKIFNWLGTLWEGNIHFTTPMMMAIGFVATFILGGLSGVFMASAAVDVYIHDTYFIVAHIHYVLFGGSVFGIFAGLYYWYPKFFGKMYNEAWGRWHFIYTFVFFNLTFFPMHMLGLAGQPRRYFNNSAYDFLKPLQSGNEFVTIMAILLGFSQLVMVFNFLYSMKWGKKAPRNPWNANTLEWAAPAYPGHGNFDTDITVYHGPYEFGGDGEEDFYPQWIYKEGISRPLDGTKQSSHAHH